MLTYYNPFSETAIKYNAINHKGAVYNNPPISATRPIPKSPNTNKLNNALIIKLTNLSN